MKPFNLEEAKAGKPVVTRNGKKARIVDFNRKSKSGRYPLVVLVAINEEEEAHYSFTINGYFNDGSEHYLDLFMAPEKKEYWVNVYGSKTGYIKTIKIHEEEI